MKIDLERAVKAPFTLTGDNKPLPTYLITGGIALGIFVISQVLSFIMQLAGGLAQTISTGEMAIVGILLVIVLTLILIVSMVALYAIPMGYITETIKLEVYNRDSVMPSWPGNFGRFFINGIKLMLLMLIYFIILGIIIALPVGLAGGLSAMSNGSSGFSQIIMILSTLFAVVMYFIFMAIFPFIWVRFAAEGSIKAGLNIIAIVKKIFSNIVDYSLAIIFWLVLTVGMIIVCLALCITCVGVLAIPLVQMFIYPIIYMNLFAQVYKD